MVTVEEVLVTIVRLLGGAEGAVGTSWWGHRGVSHFVMGSSTSPAEEVLTSTLTSWRTAPPTIGGSDGEGVGTELLQSSDGVLGTIANMHTPINTSSSTWSLIGVGEGVGGTYLPSSV